MFLEVIRCDQYIYRLWRTKKGMVQISGDYTKLRMVRDTILEIIKPEAVYKDDVFWGKIESS